MVVVGKSNGGNREGMTREKEFGEICGKEGEAPKTWNIYFCLCVSKEILAITGVLFLPGMKQKWKIRNLSLSTGNACWGRKKKVENQPMSPKASEDLDLQNLFCLVQRPRMKRSPLPTLSPSLYVELPVWFQYTGNYKHPSPQKDFRHWWLLLFNVSSLFSFCEGTIGTCAHIQVCADIPPSLLWRGVHFMAVDRSWSQSNWRFQSSQLKKIV